MKKRKKKEKKKKNHMTSCMYNNTACTYEESPVSHGTSEADTVPGSVCA